MKHNQLRKWICILILVPIFAMLLTGCSREIGPFHIQVGWAKEEEELIRVDDGVCTIPEGKILLLSEISRYRDLYGSSILEMDLPEGTVADQIKQETKNLLGKIMVLSSAAGSYNIELDRDEQELASSGAQELYNSFDEGQLEYLGIADKEKGMAVAQRLFERIVLADKVFRELSGESEKEISDDEARMVDFRHIMIRTITQDTDGRDVVMTEEQKKDAYSRILDIYDKIAAGADFDSMAEQYSEDSRIEYTVGRGEINEQLEEVLFDMQSGEMSPVVESKEGYHILLCINNYDKEATQSNKSKILQSRRWTDFEETYNGLAQNCEVEFQKAVWEDLQLPDETINNASLFAIYRGLL